MSVICPVCRQSHRFCGHTENFIFSIDQRVAVKVAAADGKVRSAQRDGDSVRAGDIGKVIERKHYPHQALNIYRVEFDNGTKAWGEEEWMEAVQ